MAGTMAFEKFDLDTLNAERRVAMAKSLHVITVDELKQIGDKLFPMAGDAWGGLFGEFIKDNRSATFHHALTSDGVNIVYCRDKDRGLWFTERGSKGPLGERGRTVMKEMIAGRH
ncbi:MAG: hypothetical protein ACJ8M4_09995 [Chthoniobacterales bacterium]